MNQSEKDKKELDDLRLVNAEIIQENSKLQKLLQLEKNVTEEYKKMHIVPSMSHPHVLIFSGLQSRS
jgi:hypothetical protein